MPHFEVTSFLAAAIGLLGLISLCLLVFGRLGVGSIVAFLVAGIVIGQVRDIPAQTILAVHEFAEIGVVLMLFLIGLEIQLDQLRRLGRDVLAFGVPQIIFSALLIGLYVWWGFEVPNKHGRLRGEIPAIRRSPPRGAIALHCGRWDALG